MLMLRSSEHIHMSHLPAAVQQYLTKNCNLRWGAMCS
jgi:hypothetical protein